MSHVVTTELISEGFSKLIDLETRELDKQRCQEIPTVA